MQYNCMLYIDYSNVEAEPMSEKDQREAGFSIEVFGLPLVSTSVVMVVL